MRTALNGSDNICAMKISVRFLIPMFALMLALFGQISTVLQYDEQEILLDEFIDVSVLALDLGDDPDSLVALARVKTVCYQSSHSFSAATHELTPRKTTCPNARAPPLV